MFDNYSIADLPVSQLISLFNQDRKKSVGWTQGRLKFMTELRDALIASGLDCSSIIQENQFNSISMSYKFPIGVVEGKIVQLTSDE